MQAIALQEYGESAIRMLHDMWKLVSKINIDNKDIDKLIPAHSEITMAPLQKGHIAQLATSNYSTVLLKTSK